MKLSVVYKLSNGNLFLDIFIIYPLQKNRKIHKSMEIIFSVMTDTSFNILSLCLHFTKPKTKEQTSEELDFGYYYIKKYLSVFYLLVISLFVYSASSTTLSCVLYLSVFIFTW